MRRKRARKNRSAESEAASSPVTTTGSGVRRTVSAPVPAPVAPQPAAPAIPGPDRIDALTEAIGGELGRLRGEMRGRDADLVQALQQVAASYDRVASRLDEERRVQSLLAEALVRIDRRLATMEGGRPEREELPRAPRVIGGSIAPRQDIPRVDR